MRSIEIETLAMIRVIVGYLGEREQYAWWQSSFFSPHSSSFLQPVFSRTADLARSNGVTQAASLVHDDRIGIGRVYHLFRLPEDMEQSLHRACHTPTLWAKLTPSLASREHALQHLDDLAQGAVNGNDNAGPVHVGSPAEMRQADAWSTVAAHYLAAFQSNAQIFPYFADKRS
jgi:hypothetical protein